jgi:hypothetical protein
LYDARTFLHHSAEDVGEAHVRLPEYDVLLLRVNAVLDESVLLCRFKSIELLDLVLLLIELTPNPVIGEEVMLVLLHRNLK